MINVGYNRCRPKHITNDKYTLNNKTSVREGERERERVRLTNKTC